MSQVSLPGGSWTTGSVHKCQHNQLCRYSCIMAQRSPRGRGHRFILRDVVPYLSRVRPFDPGPLLKAWLAYNICILVSAYILLWRQAGHFNTIHFIFWGAITNFDGQWSHFDALPSNSIKQSLNNTNHIWMRILRLLVQPVHNFTMSPSCLPPFNSSAIHIGMSELSNILTGPQWLDFYIRLIPMEAASPSFWNINFQVLKFFNAGPDWIVSVLLLAQRLSLSRWYLANSWGAFVGGTEGGVVVKYYWG